MLNCVLAHYIRLIKLNKSDDYIVDHFGATSSVYRYLFCFTSLVAGKFEWNFRYVIFKRILMIDGWGICCENALIWMSLDFTDDD